MPKIFVPVRRFSKTSLGTTLKYVSMLKDMRYSVNRDNTLFSLILGVFLMMIGNGMALSALPQRFIEITGSGEKIGYIASYYAISYIIIQIVIGNFSDKAGFRLFLFLGYFICFLSGISLYYAKTSTMIFIGRIFGGMGEAPVFALAPALLSIKYPLKKGKVIGFYNASMHMGLMIGPGIGLMVQKIWHINAIFLCYAFTCLAGLVILVFGVEEKEREKQEKQQGKSIDFKYLYDLISNKKVLTVLVGISLYGAGYGALFTIIPDFLIRFKSFSNNYTGLFFTMIYVAISMAQFTTGPLADKFGSRVFMLVGLVTASIGIFTFPYLTFNWIIVLLLTIASFGLGVFHLSSLWFLNDIVSDSYKGSISGIYYLFWGIGMFCGPLIIERFGKFFRIELAFGIFALALFLGALVMMVFDMVNDETVYDSISGE